MQGKNREMRLLYAKTLYLLRALLLEISYKYVGRSSQMVLYRHFMYDSLHAQAGFVHELAVNSISPRTLVLHASLT